MHIIADVNKISKTIPRNLNFILNVLPESSIYFTCNQFHNILRLFDVLPNLPFTTNGTMDDYYL